MIEILNKDIDHISDLQLLKECLELRLSLIGQNNSIKSEFEKNEDDITRIKTHLELNKLNALIVQKTFDVRENLNAMELESKAV
jgi:hypothetical protein